MLLIMLAMSRSRVFLSWGFGWGINSSWSSSPICLTHILMILHCLGFSLVRHWRNVFARSGSTDTINEEMSSCYFFKAWNASLSCLFTKIFIASSSSDVVFLEFREEDLGLVWDNLGWFLSAYFLPFLFACLEDTYPISMIFLLSEMFTVLKWLEIFSIPAIYVQSS